MTWLRLPWRRPDAAGPPGTRSPKEAEALALADRLVRGASDLTKMTQELRSFLRSEAIRSEAP